MNQTDKGPEANREVCLSRRRQAFLLALLKDILQRCLAYTEVH